MDEEIKKHMGYLEKGMTKTITSVLSHIRQFKGKKINISFPSLDSPRNNGKSMSS